MKFNRLWILYFVLFSSAFLTSYPSFEMLYNITRSGRPIDLGGYIPVIGQALFFPALAWSIAEFLHRQQQLIRAIGLKAVVDDFNLEDAPADKPVPEPVEVMAKRVQATISKKVSKSVSIESLTRVGDDYICRLLIDEHTYSFKIPVNRAEDSNAWIEQGRNVLQLLAS